MKAVLAVVLVLAVAVNGGVITASHQVHDVALQAPIVHAAHRPLYTPTGVLRTSSSSSYKVRAPAAKLAVGPSLPLVHAMNHNLFRR